MPLLLFTLLTACTLTDSTAVVDSANVCELALAQVAPEAALPGETIQLVLSPLTTADDTLVTIGGVRAQLVTFERAGCEDCDACRETYLCAPCLDDCDICDLGCEAECVERVEVLVPSLAPGPATIEVFNGEGASGRLTLTVLAPPEDTGGADDTGDTGDTAPPDTGGADDTAAPDTGGAQGQADAKIDAALAECPV
ncbi:MAG: hypothetical protein RIT28_3785 [Pseudomonadota bacterium]